MSKIRSAALVVVILWRSAFQEDWGSGMRLAGATKYFA